MQACFCNASTWLAVQRSLIIRRVADLFYYTIMKIAKIRQGHGKNRWQKICLCTKKLAKFCRWHFFQIFVWKKCHLSKKCHLHDGEIRVIQLEEESTKPEDGADLPSEIEALQVEVFRVRTLLKDAFVHLSEENEKSIEESKTSPRSQPKSRVFRPRNTCAAAATPKGEEVTQQDDVRATNDFFQGLFCNN